MQADRHVLSYKGSWKRIAALIAVICMAAVLVIPADAKTVKKSRKRSKAAQSVAVKYRKPDLSGYDLSRYSIAEAGIGAAMGSAVPTTAGFGEAYAAGNWKDASYYLMKDLDAKFDELGGPQSGHTVDELMTSDPSYPYPYYVLDGVRIIPNSSFASQGVRADMPQLGNGFYITALFFQGLGAEPDTGEIYLTDSSYYYGLGWFAPHDAFYRSAQPNDPLYLADLESGIQQWGYSVVLRYPDARVAQYISDQAAAGSMNTALGYSQAARLGFWNCFQKVGFDMTAITPAMKDQAYSDCSSFVSGIVKSAGYVYNIPALRNVHEYDTTMTMSGDYSKAGFKVLKYSELGAAGLQRGDILVNPTFHTAVYVPELLFADKLPQGSEG